MWRQRAICYAPVMPPMRLDRPNLSQLPPDAIVTLREVAAYLGVSVSSVRRANIPCLHVGPRCPRYVVRDVLGWVRAQTQGAA